MTKKRPKNRVCPDCRVPLYGSKTRWGKIYLCPTDGCDVRCWSGPTSHPGTPEDMQERRATHKIFDPLWKEDMGVFAPGESKGKRRAAAYRWMRELLGITGQENHIGMFRAETCRMVQSACRDMLSAMNGKSYIEKGTAK